MSMGLGMFYARSSKQKMNTKSSTETKLVGVSEYLPFIISPTTKNKPRTTIYTDSVLEIINQHSNNNTTISTESNQ